MSRFVAWLIFLAMVLFHGGCSSAPLPTGSADGGAPPADLACVPPTIKVSCAGLCGDGGVPGPCVCVPYVAEPGTCDLDAYFH